MVDTRTIKISKQEQPTYSSTLQNDNVLDDMYHVLNKMGVEVGTNRNEILDSFLTNRRYFETNIFATGATGRKIKALPKAYKEKYVRAINHVDNLPSIFSTKGGSAPRWKALKDYGIAGISDPTNLVAFVASLFTAGGGGAAIFGGKEFAKKGVRELFKAKLKATVSTPALKALGTEAVISGAGGAIQAAGAQNVDIDLGRRTKYNVSDIALQGAVEGLLTPGIGATANILGSTALRAGRDHIVKPTGKIGKQLFPEVTEATTQRAIQHGNFLLNWLLPSANLDTATKRNFEIGFSSLRPIKENAELIGDEIDIAWKKDFTKGPFHISDPKDLELVNKAMENTDEVAINIVKQRSPAMFKAIKKWRDILKESWEEAEGKRSGISNKLKNIYKLDPNYTRTIYDKTSGEVQPREPFSIWKNKVGNREDISELTNKVKGDKALQIQFNLREGKVNDKLEIIEDGGLKKWFDPAYENVKDKRGNPIYTPERADKIIEAEIYDAYYPKTRAKSKLGALKARRKDISPIMKKLWGENYNVALRATETIAGIIEPLTEIRIANQLSQSLLNRNMAVKAPSLADARAIADSQGITLDLVPLVANRYTKDATDNPDTPFKIKAGLVDKDLNQVWIPKDLAKKLKIMSDRTGTLLPDSNSTGFINTILQGFAAAQGYLKKSATVYNPYGQMRNALGMPLYVSASGNWRGIGKFANKWIKGTEVDRDRIRKLANKLGVTASSVEMNQIAARLSEINNINPENAPGVSGWLTRRFVDLAGFGMPALERQAFFKKWARGAEKAYTKVDDFGKIMALLNERDKAQKMWDDFTPEQRQAAREKYWKDFGEELPQKPRIKEPTSKEIDRMLKQYERGKTTLKDKFIAEQSTGVRKYQVDLEDFDDELLWEWGAQKALDVVPVYNRVARVFEKMKNLPILGSFMAFPAENARNTYHILRLGGEELRDGFASGNNALIKSGFNRLVSKIGVASVPSVVAYGYNAFHDTEKYMDYARVHQPEWSKYHALKIRKDKKGKLQVSDLSYNNPDQYVLDMIMPFMVSVANGEDVEKSLDNLLPHAWKKMYEPFLSPSMALTFGIEMQKYATAKTEEGSGRALAKMYKTAEPGIFKMLTDIAGDLKANEVMDLLSEKLGGKGQIGSNLKMALDPLYFGEERKYLEDSGDILDYFAKIGADPANAWALYPFGLGAKEIEMDPKKSLGFTVGNLMRNANSDYNETTRTIRKHLEQRESKMPLHEMLEELKESIEEQYAAQQGVHKLITSMSKFMSREQIRELLRSRKIKAAGSLSNKEIEALLSGRFAVPQFDQNFFKKLKRERKDLIKYIPHIQKQIRVLESKYIGKDIRDEELPIIEISK